MGDRKNNNFFSKYVEKRFEIVETPKDKEHTIPNEKKTIEIFLCFPKN